MSRWLQDSGGCNICKPIPNPVVVCEREYGKLRGFVVKMSHISCMESCVSDIYWWKSNQSPRQKDLVHSLAPIYEKTR